MSDFASYIFDKIYDSRVKFFLKRKPGMFKGKFKTYRKIVSTHWPNLNDSLKKNIRIRVILSDMRNYVKICHAFIFWRRYKMNSLNAYANSFTLP